jgi:hypothetical protein
MSLTRNDRRRVRRGNALIEFAIAFSLLISVLAGVWQFGYTFYLYNSLESAVRAGARYASLADYDYVNGPSTGAAFKNRVKNMVVYGTPNPTGNPPPVVPGLTTSKVTVTEQFNGVVPERISVRIDSFQVQTFFRTFTLNGKPRCSFDYMGRLTVP